MKKIITLFLILITASVSAQIESKNFILKSFLVKNDTVQIDTLSITPFNFKVFFPTSNQIDTTEYTINFSKALLIFKPKKEVKYNEVVVQFTPYPEFLTKKYSVFNKNLIVPNTATETQLYSLTTNQQKIPFKPFEGLNTSGNITRGLTVGNNQNGVSNSTLDLQIAGKISDKVTLKASIIDTNLPIQENGNTYKLNEFDRVFIELSSDNWQINAGDIYLTNNETYFLKFNKKVSGISVNAKIENENSEINAFTSGAIVKGKYKKIQFNGQEGNQGPYKLSDFNNTYILILSNTEQIYVNGIQLKRGEENDYVIDYNTAEITFSTTYPITSNMRITAEYQYTDRVYTRFITYNNIDFKSEKLELSGYFYNENDVKNQPLEQDLSNEQKQLLANAGNNKSEMVSTSAYINTYSEDKILYKKIVVGISEYFEYSTSETSELYSVSFTYSGENLGSYRLKDVIAFGKIYEYVGENLGSYNPVIQLIAPNKLQIAVFKGLYKPTIKTAINVETAFSKNDENLFSSIHNSDNNGIATKIGWEQLLLQKKWELKSSIKFDFIHQNFKSIERIQQLEFNRDWNIETNTGNQKLLNTSLTLSKETTKRIVYEFENLEFGDSFKGNKHRFYGKITEKKLSIIFNNSLLNNESISEKGQFIRNFFSTKYNLRKSWLGLLFNAENNKRKNINTDIASPLSHKFNEYEFFLGVGDSTKVYSQIGVNFRNTDSIQNNKFERINNSKTYYIKSKLIHSKTANLNTYINYRKVDNLNFKNVESLNSKIVYTQQLFNQFLSFSSVYQTLSGNLPQQDYTYIKTEPGQGFYTWIDYNNNGIKELNEFEIAQFPDQATYLRTILPTIKYIATLQNKFTQSFTINPQQWSSKNGFKKFVSYFYNQTFILIDNKQQKQQKFNLNPFDLENNNLLGLNFNINNSIYFNRAKKWYSTTYTFLSSQNKNTTTIDDLENKMHIHKLQFEHKLGDFWQVNLEVSESENELKSLNYLNRNYIINTSSLFPKISYFYNDNTYFSASYELKNKENMLGKLESLNLQRIGFEINYVSNDKNILKAEINLFNNSFAGNNNSPVGYQMLEGLQPGKNYTWSLLFYRKINDFLNLNVNYLGRKSETSKTIHTGTIQLKALF